MGNVSKQKRKKRPMYRDVYEELKGLILSGEYLPGTKVPTEPELQKRFNASRVTIRLGVDMLVNEGLLDRQQGRGTFVPVAVRRRLRVLCVVGLNFASSHHHHLGSYYSDLIVFSQEQAAAAGWELEIVWLPTYQKAQRFEAYCEEEVLRQYVAFLFLACGSNHPVLLQVQKMNLRYSIISPTHLIPNGVYLDYPQGISLAIQQFDDDKAKAIVLMGVGYNWDLVMQSLAEVSRKAILVNVPVDPGRGTLASAGYERTMELIRDGQDLSRLLVLDDNVALGVTRALLSLGYKDRPIKVVVMVGKQEIEPMGMPVTYVVHDTEEEVRHAFQSLRQQMDDRSVALPVWFSSFSVLPPQEAGKIEKGKLKVEN